MATRSKKIKSRSVSYASTMQVSASPGALALAAGAAVIVLLGATIIKSTAASVVVPDLTGGI
jgi:hypothetical protein